MTLSKDTWQFADYCRFAKLANVMDVPYDIQRRAVFANGMKAARNRSGLSAQQAAALLTAHGLECTRGTLLAWERGQGPTTREPFASDLTIIARVYGCSVDEFFSSEEAPGSPAIFASNALRKADGNGQSKWPIPGSDPHSG